MTPLPQIMVAPNGARRTKADHPELPVTVAETVATAKTCFETGAGGLHAHVRDEEQRHVLDVGLYRELIAEMTLQVPGMLVQITTEAVGRYSANEQRQLVRDVMPQAVSIGMKEMLSDGDVPAARNLYHFAVESGIAVQHIVYSGEELAELVAHVEGGIIPDNPLMLLFVLGRYTKGQQSDPADMKLFLSVLDESGLTADWAVCAFGRNETACLKAAIEAGGKARVGFENSLLNNDGSMAKDNAERVADIASAFAKTASNA